MSNVDLNDYTTVQGIARMVKVTPPRVHRIVRFLGLPSHKIGSHILIRKSFATRVKRVIETGEMRAGPKTKAGKKKGLALRAAPKHRLVTTQ